jgi:DNA repair protein RecN (Recombination protein N)
VPVRTLGELAGGVVAIHGQADQYRLLRPGVQRDALDAYGGSDLRRRQRRYAETYQRWSAAAGQLKRLRASVAERAADAARLGEQLAAFDVVAPQPAETTEIAAEIDRLAHADALRRAADDAREALAGSENEDGGASSLLLRARRALDAERVHDGRLGALADRIAETALLVDEAATELASYATSIQTDPRRLQAARERQAALSALTRRHGPDLLGWATGARSRLAELDADDGRVEYLATEAAGQLGELAAAAADLSAGRSAAADRLGAQLAAELTELAMPSATTAIRVRQREQPNGLPVVDGRRVAFGPHGIDEVEMLLASGPGTQLRPLARAASGGELSRVMLALEVVLAGTDRVPTLVFDEVDAGVGGQAAAQVGQRLARLGEHAQVIAVSHLPQIAAFADRQLVVRRSDTSAVTTSDVVAITGEARVRELSRMLAGRQDSALAHGHAEELLAGAASDKQAGRMGKRQQEET